MEVISNPGDEELVSNLRSGSKTEESIKIIYRDYFDSLTWYIINNNGSRQDAEDIFQEVVVNFIQIVKNDRFRGNCSVKTFLYSLNRHAWLNELKRKGRKLAREEKFGEGMDLIQPDVYHELAERETSRQLTDLVNRLDENCKTILYQFYYENLSMKEILEKLHYENEQVVRNKKYKCLKRLEEMMNENPALKHKLKSLLHG